MQAYPDMCAPAKVTTLAPAVAAALARAAGGRKLADRSIGKNK